MVVRRGKQRRHVSQAVGTHAIQRDAREGGVRSGQVRLGQGRLGQGRAVQARDPGSQFWREWGLDPSCFRRAFI